MNEKSTMSSESLGKIKQEGFERGYVIAKQVNAPEIGDQISPNIHWTGQRVCMTFQDQCEALELLCNDIEEKDREYASFEFIRAELDSMEDPTEAWSAYNDGVFRGIAKRVHEFYRSRRG